MASKLRQITPTQYLELLECGVDCWAEPDYRKYKDSSLVMHYLSTGGDLALRLEDREMLANDPEFSFFTLVEGSDDEQE